MKVASHFQHFGEDAWVMVSCAADRSTKKAPVISSLSKPSSMCSVRLSSWSVNDEYIYIYMYRHKT